MSQLCECGCGTPVTNRFARGHNARVANPQKVPARDRLLAAIEEVDGCWLWARVLPPNGRPLLFNDGSPRIAARLAYEEWIGPIPEGLEVDHLCGKRACINPEHLEAVTKLENTRRYWASQTGCRRGHPWSEENTGWHKGGRVCRACRRERYHARKAASA